MKSTVLFTKAGKILEIIAGIVIIIGMYLVFIDDSDTLGFAIIFSGTTYFFYSFGVGIGLEGFTKNPILTKMFRRRLQSEFDDQ